MRKAVSRADAGKRDRLERTRWIRLKNWANWTEKEPQKWESMALERYVTGMAYEIRLVLQGIYGSQDSGEPKKLFRNRWAWVHAMRGQTGELLETIVGFARMIDCHLLTILACRSRGLSPPFMLHFIGLSSDGKGKAFG